MKKKIIKEGKAPPRKKEKGVDYRDPCGWQGSHPQKRA